MPSGHRKKPFSNKQKKEQLRDKRERKREQQAADENFEESKIVHNLNKGSQLDSQNMIGISKLQEQPISHQLSDYDPNRFKLHFMKDTKEEIERRKRLARKPYVTLREEELEICIDDIYQPGSSLDMPKRPEWNYSLSKHQLEMSEDRYFQNYLQNIFGNFSMEALSYFELNLETWRQLWRVIEMSDCIFLITDIRHPVLHFPPTLYNHVVSELGKHLVLILNKIDLVPAEVVIAWKHYFVTKFPQLHVVLFSATPRHDEVNPGKIAKRKRNVKKRPPVGLKDLYKASRSIVGDKGIREGKPASADFLLVLQIG